MAANKFKPETDRTEEVLAEYERSEREFRDHWIWKDLGVKPEDFFEAVKRHVNTLGLPKETWQRAYEDAKETSRVRSRERRAAYHPMNLKLIGSIRA